jgi:hypothetical protein
MNKIIIGIIMVSMVMLTACGLQDYSLEITKIEDGYIREINKDDGKCYKYIPLSLCSKEVLEQLKNIKLPANVVFRQASTKEIYDHIEVVTESN